MRRMMVFLCATACFAWGQKPVETPQAAVMKRLDTSAEMIGFRSPKQNRQAMGKMAHVLLDLAQDRITKNTGFTDRDKASFSALVSMGRYLVDNCGMDTVTATGFSRKYLDDDMVLMKRYTLLEPGERSTYWKIKGTKNHPLAGLKMLPDTTALAWWSDLDLGALYDFHLKMVDNSKYPEFIANYAKVRKQWNEMMGVDSLRPGMTEIGIGVMFDSSKMIKFPYRGKTVEIPEPSMAVFIKADLSGMPARANGFLKSKRMKLDPTTVDGVVCHTLNLRETLPVDFSPSMAMVDGYFVMSSNLATLKRIIGATQGKAPGLTTTKTFKSLAKGVPTEGTGFTYLTPKLKHVMTDLKTKTQSLPIESESLRDFAALAQKANAAHMFGVRSVDSEGILTVSHESSNLMYAKTLVPISIAAIGAGMTLPVLTKAREKARRVNCSGNLKQFGLALIMYADDHKDLLPDSLAQLKSELPPGKVYVCPSTENAPPKTAEDVARGQSDYAYFGMSAIPFSKIPDPTSTVLMADKTGNHSGGWYNVLFADGHVEGASVPNGNFRALCKRRGWTLMSDLKTTKEVR